MATCSEVNVNEKIVKYVLKEQSKLNIIKPKKYRDRIYTDAPWQKDFIG